MKIKKIIYTCICIFLSLTVQSQCIDDTHSPFKDQGWLSCSTSQSPNTSRGNSHWLMYDLGHNYVIDSLTIWNHNVWGETENGARWIIVDYSNDKTNWETAGTFRIQKAPGSWKYQTTDVVDLNHSEGRYYLVTVLEAHDENASCVGIAEIRFEVGISVSTDDELAVLDWTVYPNPTVEYLNIELDDSNKVDQIVISNALGQNMENLNNITTSKIQLDILKYPEGIYYVSVIKEGKSEVKSFVKIDTN